MVVSCRYVPDAGAEIPQSRVVLERALHNIVLQQSLDCFAELRFAAAQFGEPALSRAVRQITHLGEDPLYILMLRSARM